MRYRREIDGLRAVAVLPVILFHAGLNVFSGGYVGVDVFFVISGYLITAILIAELERHDFSILRFYERRARRILPALFVVMACCIPFAWAWMTPWQFSQFGNSLVAVALFGSNILFWSQSGYFDGAAAEKPLLHTWSLAVEEQYYLLFPLFLLLLWRLGRRRVFVAVAVIAVLSLGLSEYAARAYKVANFFLPPTRAWELLAGSACAFLSVGRPQRAGNMLSLAGLGLILLAIFAYDERTPFPSLYALAPVGGTALIILFAGPGTLVARLLSLRAFVGLGLISYSAYLWHQPLFAFARIRTFGEPSMALMMSLAAAALVLAWFSWRFVEQPFRTKPAPFFARRASVFAASGVAGAAMIAIGIWFSLAPAAPGRLPPAVMDRFAELIKMEEDRTAILRDGECHFTGRGKYQRIGPFMENWACLGRRDPALPDLNIVVFGDSHAANLAYALRMAGFDVGQMTGNGCSMLADFWISHDCRQLLAGFHRVVPQRVPADGETMVILGNRYLGGERTPAYIQAVVNDWAKRYDHVILMGPMPEFPELHRIYPFLGPDMAPALRLDMSAAEAFNQSVAQIDLPANVRVIPIAPILCGDRPKCFPMLDGHVLLTDYGHLAPEGARLIGKAVLSELRLRPKES